MLKVVGGGANTRVYDTYLPCRNAVARTVRFCVASRISEHGGPLPFAHERHGVSGAFYSRKARVWKSRRLGVHESIRHISASPKCSGAYCTSSSVASRISQHGGSLPSRPPFRRRFGCSEYRGQNSPNRKKKVKQRLKVTQRSQMAQTSNQRETRLNDIAQCLTSAPALRH